ALVRPSPPHRSRMPRAIPAGRKASFELERPGTGRRERESAKARRREVERERATLLPSPFPFDVAPSPGGFPLVGHFAFSSGLSDSQKASSRALCRREGVY